MHLAEALRRQGEVRQAASVTLIAAPVVTTYATVVSRAAGSGSSPVCRVRPPSVTSLRRTKQRYGNESKERSTLMATDDRLLAAGFQVIQGTVGSESLLSHAEAWRLIASSSVVPAVKIAYSGRSSVGAVEDAWREKAFDSGLVGTSGTFLLCLAGLGGATSSWVRVRLSGRGLDFRNLGPNVGEPEFVAMSDDGRVLIGVTAEEYDRWIICLALERR